jgi:hypothetical protein
MHRYTPLMTSFRAFSAGGARSIVDKVDDGTLMQEMAGNFMKGETRDKVEAPQNYGFSSVVMPAKKGKDGQIEESAEAIMSFIGGNRSHPIAAMMDDRRFRPLGLKPGENSQYDDNGQMTLMRRTGLFLLSLDSEEESSSGGGGATATQHAESGGSGGEKKKVERMVSLRHVEKKKQERQKSQQKTNEARAARGEPPLSVEQWAAQVSEIKKKNEDFKHEGETVNTEIRCTKNRIEFRAGDKVVGYYDVQKDEWQHKAKTIKNEASSISHKGVQYFDEDIHVMKKVIAMDGLKPGNGDWGTGTPSSGPSLLDPAVAGEPAELPPDVQAYVARKQAQADALEARLAKMEARLAELEARIA